MTLSPDLLEFLSCLLQKECLIIPTEYLMQSLCHDPLHRFVHIVARLLPCNDWYKGLSFQAPPSFDEPSLKYDFSIVDRFQPLAHPELEFLDYAVRLQLCSPDV